MHLRREQRARFHQCCLHTFCSSTLLLLHTRNIKSMQLAGYAKIDQRALFLSHLLIHCKLELNWSQATMKILSLRELVRFASTLTTISIYNQRMVSCNFSTWDRSWKHIPGGFLAWKFLSPSRYTILSSKNKQTNRILETFFKFLLSEKCHFWWSFSFQTYGKKKCLG